MAHKSRENDLAPRENTPECFFKIKNTMNYLTIAVTFPLWGVISLAITGFVLYFPIKRWNEKNLARAAEKDHADNLLRLEERRQRASVTKDKKVAYTIECVENKKPVRWKDILYIARYHDMNIVKLSRILPYIHLAELQKILIAKEDDAKHLHWNGGELHVALTLIEDIARYQQSINDEEAVQKLVKQLHSFLKYCKVHYEDFKGYKRILKEVSERSPTLYRLLSEK